MKKILKLYQHWRYRRLLRKLFWFYAQKSDNACQAIRQANDAFVWFTNAETDENDWVNYWWYL